MRHSIFLSHAGRDAAWIRQVAASLREVDVDLYLFEHDQQPGRQVAEKIQEAIRRSHAVVVLLTANGVASAYVQQEVGYALRDGKLVVPLVARGVDVSQLAMLLGVEYIAFDVDDPQQGLATLATAVRDIVERQRKQGQDAVVAACLLALLALVVLGSSASPS